MNMQSDALSDSFEARRAAPAVTTATHPLYWCVRRELLENRWIIVGQLGVAALFLFGFLISLFHLPAQMRALAEGGATQQWHLPHHQMYWNPLVEPYNIAAGLMMGTLILMSLFYSADALHGERRDRSILFWKSLPVSDLMTVMAKASIPLVVLPLLTFAVTVVMQIVMLMASTLVLAASGFGVGVLWSDVAPVTMWGNLIYHLFSAHALWPFPVFCWLILVSGWARRATLLWAALPVLAISGIEKLASHASTFLTLVATRVIGGGAPTDYTPGDLFPLGPMTHLTPLRFLSAPGLWIGLILAAIFLAAAVRLRRYQGAI